jgi:hypothetical protein
MVVSCGASGEGQHIFVILKAQHLASLRRDQPAHDGRDLCRDGAPLPG